MKMNLADIAHHVGGILMRSHSPHVGSEGDIVIRSVLMDSRTLGADALFVCIVGNVTDGHLHAKGAVDNGAIALLAERDPFIDDEAPYNAIPVILVSNTVQALGKLANAHRKTMQGKVIGITGTAGKTTVKELLWQLLSTNARVSKSAKNHNNQIGLPLSMLAGDINDAYWVMEVGISQAHDMHELGTILEPDMVLILNAGAGHTEGLGEKGVAYHKASLITHLTNQGEAIVSADYADLMQALAVLRSEQNQKKVSKTFTTHFFSTSDTDISYRAEYIGVSEANKGLFNITLDGQEFETKAPFLTAFGEENLIAVASMAHRLGLSKQAIIDGLSRATLPSQRFTCTEYGDVCCIDDSYNANPLSCMRSITAAHAMTKGKDLASKTNKSSKTNKASKKNKPLVDVPNKPLVCIMGEMLELGSITAEEHIQLGQQLAVADAIFWVGNQWEHILQGLENAGFAGIILPCKTPESFIEAYKALALPRAVVLFKGSRSNKLEYFVEAFKIHMQNPVTIAHSLHKSL